MAEMNEGRETLVEWLRDAHSMELGLIPVLENHANDAKAYPEIASRIREHLEETKRHASLVEGCITQLGEDTSTMKNLMGSVMGSVSAVTTAVAEDELVKNALADFAAEHLEIASYTSLVAAAEELGEADIARVCREILADEKKMAAWLESQIGTITTTFLQKKMAGVE